MDLGEPHSLDGWEAIKSDPFRNPPPEQTPPPNKRRGIRQRSKPAFHVSWTQDEQFAVTFTERERMKSDVLTGSYSTTLTVNKIQEAHACLRHLAPSLDAVFPEQLAFFAASAQPSSSYGDYLWNTVTSGLQHLTSKENVFVSLSPSQLDALCVSLQCYLLSAYERCSKLTVLTCVFEEEFHLEEYYENLSELRHKSYVSRVDDGRTTLAACAHTMDGAKRGADVLLESTYLSYLNDLSTNLNALLIALSEYYVYLRKPFLDLREVSLERLQMAEMKLEDADIGHRVVAELSSEMTRWKQELQNCRENVRELTLEYFTETVGFLKDYHAQLVKEAQYCCKRSELESVWHKLSQELKHTALELSAERLNLLRCRVSQLKAERRAVVLKISELVQTTIDEQVLMRRLGEMEFELYEKTNRLLNAREACLMEQQKQLRLQLEQIHNQRTPNDTYLQGIVDGTDVFFDAVEDTSQLDKLLRGTVVDPKLATIKAAVVESQKQLALIRTQKKRIATQKVDGSFLESCAKKENSEQFELAIQKRFSQESKLRSEGIRRERDSTLNRIRQYRTKNPVLEKKRPVYGIMGKPKPVAPTTAKSLKVLNKKTTVVKAVNHCEPVQTLSPPNEATKAPAVDDTTTTTVISDLTTTPAAVTPISSCTAPSPPPPPPPPPPLPPNFLLSDDTSAVIRFNVTKSANEKQQLMGSQLLDAIRGGVKLRKVGDEQRQTTPHQTAQPSLMQALKLKLDSIRKAAEEDLQSGVDDDSDHFSD